MNEEPRIAIGSWPTPVRRLDRVSDTLGAEVWAKLEEGCGAWGGNKVRKLEYLLGRARADGVTKLVSFGAGTSNWTSALAFHGRSQGFGVSIVLSANQVPARYAELYDRLGTDVRYVGATRFAWEVTGARLRPDQGTTRFLALGGTEPVGTRGSLHTGREIAEAIAGRELPSPKLMFVATGTAGTAAGVAAGCAAAGMPLKVVCVRVTPRPYGTTRRVRRAIASIGGCVPSGSLIADDRFFAPGYARSNPASAEAARIALLDGIDLDPTYAAKAFASLVAHARAGAAGPLLFLHTSPGPPPEL